MFKAVSSAAGLRSKQVRPDLLCIIVFECNLVIWWRSRLSYILVKAEINNLLNLYHSIAVFAIFLDFRLKTHCFSVISACSKQLTDWCHYRVPFSIAFTWFPCFGRIGVFQCFEFSLFSLTYLPATKSSLLSITSLYIQPFSCKPPYLLVFISLLLTFLQFHQRFSSKFAVFSTFSLYMRLILLLSCIFSATAEIFISQVCR